MDNDCQQPVHCDTSDLVAAKADGSLNEAAEDLSRHTQPALTMPQEIELGSVEIVEDLTPHTNRSPQFPRACTAITGRDA